MIHNIPQFKQSNLIGNTPLICLERITKGIKGKVYAKLESYNPGNSSKDRIAKYIIDDAERKNLLKPGDTVIESSSGNTAYSLAWLCRERGYKCIITIKSSSSAEKIAILQAMGATVYVCPAQAANDDPNSFYEKAKSLHQQTPNSLYINQYYNTGNILAHYYTTGPEIFAQTNGCVSHIIAGAGTGGTISGVGRYFKERKPNTTIIAADSIGSVYKAAHEKGVEEVLFPGSTTIEGVGKNMVPGSIDFNFIDTVVKADETNALYYTRMLALEEGIMAGHSSGATVDVLFKLKHLFNDDSVIVLFFPDHGSRYLSKAFNDEWLQKQSFYNDFTAEQLDKMKLANVIRL